VLDSERTVANAIPDHSKVRVAIGFHRSSPVHLIKALGGGFESDATVAKSDPNNTRIELPFVSQTKTK
jgi:hypothetical protein